MVTLFFLIRYIGVRATLEDGYLLVVACLDIRTAEVADFSVCIARPYVINLAFLELTGREGFAGRFAVVGRNGGRNIHLYIIFSGNNGEMRTLCTTCSTMVGWRIGVRCFISVI